MSNLVYIHIGNNIPDCLYDSLYQSILLHGYKVKIYIILDDTEIPTFYREVSKFNLNVYSKNDFYYKNIIKAIPLSILDTALYQNASFDDYKKTVSDRFSELAQFRNGFWVSTTARFYYIGILMKLFYIKDVFHIENDVMLYETLDNIKKLLENSIDKICMVQDSPNRVIPSILFFPNTDCIDELTQYITTTIKSSPDFINDMNILGSFNNKYLLPILPNESVGDLIFDGAAIGQYLGGVDYKNLPGGETDIVKYNNPSKGFINETAEINCTDYKFLKTSVILDHLNISIKINMIRNWNDGNDGKLNQIANLHIHSKQLYQFSSVFDINFDDIITGDRITSLCDFVLVTPEIYNFHKNLDKFTDINKIIIIKNFNNININLLNSYFINYCKRHKKNIVKIFLYTHIVTPFIQYILPFLDKQIKYVVYIHNSDNSFSMEYSKLINSDIIKKIYTQNVDVNIESDKITLLPIGIANSMWKHGNLLELYSVMSNYYKIDKKKSIYVNINPNTYSYRKIILDKIIEIGDLEISGSKPYKEYLIELSRHRFCLCIRGNGIDTHRFWESLYLGVIPVIINNKDTKCNNFVNYLNKLEIPFYEIKSDNLEKYTNEYFNEKLYKNIIKKNGKSIFNIDSLKLQYYEYKLDVI